MAQEPKEPINNGFAVANRMARAESREIWAKIQGSRKIQAFTQARSVTTENFSATATVESGKPTR